jgi:hypothetical protein
MDESLACSVSALFNVVVFLLWHSIKVMVNSRSRLKPSGGPKLLGCQIAMILGQWFSDHGSVANRATNQLKFNDKDLIK